MVRVFAVVINLLVFHSTIPWENTWRHGTHCRKIPARKLMSVFDFNGHGQGQCGRFSQNGVGGGGRATSPPAPRKSQRRDCQCRTRYALPPHRRRVSYNVESTTAAAAPGAFARDTTVAQSFVRYSCRREARTNQGVIIVCALVREYKHTRGRGINRV